MSCPTAEIERAGHQHLLGAVGGPGPHRPGGRLLVPRRAEHLGPPPDVGADTVLVHDRGEVPLQLGLASEELGPVVARLEAVAVEVVAHVDPRAGVGVLPPGAADPGVLLEDGERDAGLLEPDAGEQTGLAAADHHHRKGLAVGVVTGRLDPAGVPPVELHLLHQERDVLLGHLLAHQPAHHLVDQPGGQWRGIGAAPGPVVTDDLEGQRAGVGLVLLAHVPLDLVEEQAGRPQPAADDPGVAGHVDQREQEGGDRDVEQGLGDLVVGGVERLARVGIAHRRTLRRTTRPPALRMSPGVHRRRYDGHTRERRWSN